MRKIARLALLGFASGAAMGGGILLAATTAQAALIEREITIALDESQISGGEWGVSMVTYDVPATLNEGDTLRTSVIFGGGESLTLFNSDPTYWVVVFSRVGLPLPNSFTTVSEGSLFFTGVEGFPLTKPSTGGQGTTVNTVGTGLVSVLTLSSFSFTGFVAEQTVDEVGSDWTGPRSFEAFSARFYGATDFQITAAPAPEPAALGLLGLGPAGLGLMRRRRGN